MGGPELHHESCSGFSSSDAQSAGAHSSRGTWRDVGVWVSIRDLSCWWVNTVKPTHDDETVMNGAP
jgi:hypothetical protein